ncbi:MAG: ferrous iron transporter B [Nitrospira bacterium SG8_35_1]|nr:MAG: ferrous iron transporter B [Nitrospira bacterium SG8_35_1]
MRIALAGQPNCGKSTIFNALAGYKAVTANFPGKTVQYTLSSVTFGGNTFEIVDLPGIYSLTSMDLAEFEARKYILSGKADIVINVVDASLLSRSLEFTIQLMDMDIPMVLCLNMMDEARRKGININAEKLSEILGIPVVETIAVKGQGLGALFSAVRSAFDKNVRGKAPSFHKDVEETIAKLSGFISEEVLRELRVPGRLLSKKLAEGDDFFMKEIERFPHLLNVVRNYQAYIEKTHGRPSDMVISSERHAIAMNIFEEAATVGRPIKTFHDRIDKLIMHRVLGYIFLILVLLGFFSIVFEAGKAIEEPIIAILERLMKSIVETMGEETLISFFAKGIIEGLAGGIGIVLPYLFPFLLGMSVLEDVGYLPRMAFLMDAFMHKIGLHGKSVLPFVLGYGCTVPAIMATRILETPRDRFITAFLATMVPCAARTTIIYGLVAYYIGPWAALFIYVLNLFVIALTGKILTHFMPEVTPGLILEIPSLKMPSINVVLAKTWLRLKEFMFIAWPLLIIGSTVLSFLEYTKGDILINSIMLPLTYVLGLPASVGTTLIFGILRKELSMIMLFQALGTMDVSSVMSREQIMIFTLFVLFYVPCVATIAVLGKELGWKKMSMVSLATLIVACLIALAARVFMAAIRNGL